MFDILMMKVADLAKKCDLNEEETTFLQELAEYLAFPDENKINPEDLPRRALRKLKEKRCFAEYQGLVREYMEKATQK